MIVRADDRHIPTGGSEQNFINGCTKFNLAAEEFCKFRVLTVGAMDQSDARWRQTHSCQMPPQSDQPRDKKFDLMPIVVPANTDIMDALPIFMPLRYSSDTPSFAIDPYRASCCNASPNVPAEAEI